MLVERFPDLRKIIQEKLKAYGENSCVTVPLKECDDVVDFL